MDIKNNLAERILYALSDTNNHFSLSDDAIVLSRDACFKKIKHYIEWIRLMKINSVMVLSTPSIDALCLCYALVLSNKTYIPIHTSTSSELLETYLKAYQVDLLLVQPGLTNPFHCELKTKLIEDKDAGFFYYLSKEKNQLFCLIPGIVLFTSGTTKQPKAVHYHYNTLYRYLTWCLEEFKLSNEDHFLFTTELSFVASLRPLFVPTLAGASVSFIGNHSNNKLQLIVNVLLNKKITILNLTPTLCKILLQHIENSTSLQTLSSIRLILLSGEPIDIQVIHHWFTQIKEDIVFYNLYGATEYLVPFYKKINTPLQEKDRLHLGQLREGSDYKLLPDSTKGYELCVTGDISSGYVDTKPTKNDYVIIDNHRYIKTNDFVQRSNNELFFCSRSQRIIKRYGQLINLDQIEYVLKQSQNAIDFIALSDEQNENKIYLIIHGSPDDDKLLRQIKLNLTAHLPGYMHPTEYIFTKELPLTPSGKVDYLLIKKTFIHDEVYDFSDYFKPFFRGKDVNRNKKIIDLGLESIDYIEMADKFYKMAGKWLDVSKINNDTKISNIASCLVDLNVEKLTGLHAVRLNPIQQSVYKKELQNNTGGRSKCFVASFCLKSDLDIKKLERSITETLANHFMLTSKLDVIDNDYFFVRTKVQSNIRLRNPIFLSRRALAKLNISIYSDGLVRVYLQKKRRQYFLIMAYHHIALDGWSAMMVREEIFQRYEGAHEIKPLKEANEIEYLNIANQFWPNHNDNTNELKLQLSRIIPNEYNQLDSYFSGFLQKQHACFSIEKDSVDRFAYKNKIHDTPYSVIFILLLYQIISNETGVNKLFFYTSFSNRNLPIPRIKELLTNLATGLPVFFDNTNWSIKEFAAQIKDNLTAYFKNMSYGNLVKIWQDEIISRSALSLQAQPYLIIFTYINKIVENTYTQNNYIDWNKSSSELNPGNEKENKGKIFFRVYNMGSHFVINLNCQIRKELHNNLVKGLKELMGVE